MHLSSQTVDFRHFSLSASVLAFCYCSEMPKTNSEEKRFIWAYGFRGSQSHWFHQLVRLEDGSGRVHAEGEWSHGEPGSKVAEPSWSLHNEPSEANYLPSACPWRPKDFPLGTPSKHQNWVKFLCSQTISTRLGNLNICMNLGVISYWNHYTFSSLCSTVSLVSRLLPSEGLLNPSFYLAQGLHGALPYLPGCFNCLLAGLLVFRVSFF